MKGIIPTGGRGTRMQPLTFSQNKHFIPVANKPLIFYPIETVAQAGIREIGITYNPGFLDDIKNLLGDGSRWGLKFTYVLQEKPIGLANIIQVCEEYLSGDPFVLHLGDNIFINGIKKAVNHFLREKPNGLVTMIKHRENQRMGVPYFDDRGRLVRYVEKPENPPHKFAVPGLYFADHNFFKCFNKRDGIKPSTRGEYEIPTAFQWLIDHDFRVDVVEYRGKWLDPGKFDDWLEANRYLLDRNLEETAESPVRDDVVIEGRVAIGKNCTIFNSRLRGPVSVADNVTIKNSYIGPFTSIDHDALIEGSHIENSVLMAGVKIVNIGQPIDTSLIGMNAEVLNDQNPVHSLHLFIGEKSQVKI